MYKVMIVDDETIILSGIKSLVDWEKNDCVVSATARNGQDALDQIRKSQPDIVLADINMPVMDGITLMKKVNEEFAHIVFIILTNLEEFELARQAIKYRAVDYLVKSQMETPILEKALEHAKEEREKRGQLIVVDAADYFEKKKQKEVLNKALQEAVFFKPGSDGGEYLKVLAESDVFLKYAYFYIPLNFSATSEEEPPEKKDKTKQLGWIRDLAVKITENIFHENYILLDTGSVNYLVLFVYHINENNWKQKVEIFSRKLCSTLKNITRTECQVYYTNVHDGYDELKLCAGEYQSLLERYYLGMSEDEYEAAGGGRNYEPLGLRGIGMQLGIEILQKNLKGIHSVIDSAQARIKSVPHQKSQAIWLLNELNREASAALTKLGVMENSSYERVIRTAAIENITTREQVLNWLIVLGNTLEDMVGNGEMPGNLLAKKAHQYVLDNIESRIGLKETADYVGVSMGYLSTIFKREYGQSFVDFINRTKMEYACRLLEEKNLLVMEIAYRLGYENAYYFSKVFRKYMGMSPTDYQKLMAK